MKRTSLSLSIVSALLLAASVPIHAKSTAPLVVAPTTQCVQADDPDSCIAQQYQELEQAYAAFNEKEVMLEQQLNELHRQIDQVQDSDSKEQFYEKVAQIYERMEAIYQQTEKTESRTEDLYEKESNIEEQLGSLYSDLATADANADEQEAKKIAARIKGLQHKQNKLHVQAIKLGFGQIDSLYRSLTLKEKLIEMAAAYLERDPGDGDINKDGEQDNEELLPDIDRDFPLHHTQHCIDGDEAMACLRETRRQARDELRQVHLEAELFHEQISDAQEQHQELFLAGYDVTENGFEIIAEIEQQWQQKHQLHLMKRAYQEFAEELHEKREEINENLQELAECLRYCETTDERDSLQQQFDALYAERVNITARLIEIKFINKDLQLAINVHLGTLVDLSEALVTLGMEQAPEEPAVEEPSEEPVEEPSVEEPPVEEEPSVEEVPPTQG